MLDLTHLSCNMLAVTHTCSLSPFCEVSVVLLDSHLVTFSCRTGRRMSCSSSVQPVIMKLRIPSSMHSLVSWLQPVSHLEETLIIFFPNGCYVSLMGDQLRCGFSPAGGEKTRGGDNLWVKPHLVFCCGTFLSNYDPIVGCCVLSAPPRPEMRQGGRRHEERRRKRGGIYFKIRGNFLFLSSSK